MQLRHASDLEKQCLLLRSLKRMKHLTGKPACRELKTPLLPETEPKSW